VVKSSLLKAFPASSIISSNLAYLSPLLLMALSTNSIKSMILKTASFWSLLMAPRKFTTKIAGGAILPNLSTLSTTPFPSASPLVSFF